MACIVMAHHSTKKSTEDLARDPFSAIRGASALRGYYDSAIVIFRKDEESKLRKVHFELRSGEAPEPLTVLLTDGRFQKADEMTAITPEIARTMLKILASKWGAKKPLSNDPRTRPYGRYAPFELSRALDIPAGAIRSMLAQWFSSGMIAIETFDKKNSGKGIKVIGEQ